MNQTHQKADELISRLRLEKHPEGGYYREIYRAAAEVLVPWTSGKRSAGTSIYYLLQGNDFSAFHKIKSDEIIHFYEGSPVKIHQIHSNGKSSIVILGSSKKSGCVYQTVIPAGNWFALEMENKDSFALLGCTVAPGFDFSDFEVGARKVLLKQFPGLRGEIEKLTREA